MRLITINTRNPDYSNTIGQRVGLSYLYIKTVNYVYCQSKIFLLFELNSMVIILNIQR